MRISTTAWLIIILVLIAIGEGIYIYATRTQPPSIIVQDVIRENKEKDSIIDNRNGEIAALTYRLVISEQNYDQSFQEKKALSGMLDDASAIINKYSDSLDYFREKLDTPHFVQACDTLQIKADSLVIISKRKDSIIQVGDSFIWLIGRQKDSVNDALHDQVLVLKAHDSATTKQLLTTLKSDQKHKQSDKFLIKAGIGGIVAAFIAGLIIK